MHFYHLNIWLFVIAVVTLFVVSYFTRPPSAEQLSMLKLKPPQDPTLRPWYAGYKPWAVLFFVCVAALYLYFD